MEELKLSHIQEAMERLSGVLHPTTLERSDTLSRMACCELYLKAENLQKTGSFKIRGAYNRLITLTEEEKTRGVIAASAGNHAQGVAFGAALLGIPAVIVMPEAAPISKVMATKGYGAEVVLAGHSYDEAYEYAKKLQQERGLTYVHAFDDPMTIAGQGTIGLELLRDLPALDAVVVPVGGGGLIAGVALAIKSLKPRIKVYGVQSSGAPAMVESMETHSLHEAPCQWTIADGIAVRCPGQLTFNLVDRLVDKLVMVDDEEISKAMLLLMERCKLVAEGSGAVPVAALVNGKIPDIAGKKVAAVISGGNVDVNMLAHIMERGLVEAGRFWRFRTVLADRPGALQALLSLLAQTGANISTVHHERLSPFISLTQAEVEVAMETRDHAHIAELRRRLSAAEYPVLWDLGSREG